MPCNVRFHLRQLQPLVPHSTWWRTVLHAEEEEALKGQIMQCEGKCTVTRGNCYQSCR